MEIKIKETGKIEGLSIIDPKSGCDWSMDLVGNTTDDFGYDDNEGMTIMTEEQYQWYTHYCKRHESADYRFYCLMKDVTDNSARDRFMSNRANLDFDMDAYPGELDALCDEIEESINA